MRSGNLWSRPARKRNGRFETAVYESGHSLACLGSALILGEAVRLPMRTMIQAPSRDRRPDSQDPLICDEAAPDDSMTLGGWNLQTHIPADYRFFVENWLQQNPVPTMPRDFAATSSTSQRA